MQKVCPLAISKHNNLLKNLETVAKIVASILIPLTIAWMGNQVAKSSNQRETEAKLVELATVILTKEAAPNQTQEQKMLRKWAVDVINLYSGVAMAPETQDALVNKVALPSTKTADDAAGTFAVIFGADKTLSEAEYETKKVANAQIFLRSGSYRSAVVASSRAEAEDVLGQIKKIKNDAYIVDMDKWCPNTARVDQHFECQFRR